MSQRIISALQGILDIGKRDMSNPKYDGYFTEAKQALEELKICPTCHHSMENNQHGFDQNDGHMEGEKLILSGRCTYCKICRGVDNED